jgi:hypothetical protein
MAIRLFEPLELRGVTLDCLLATGLSDQATGEHYHWGIRWRTDSLAATITDNNETAISGPSIQIIVDRIHVGTYPIGRRVGANGFHSVTAEISGADKDRLLSVISVGGAMQFVTNTSTYSAPLEGASLGLQNLRACSIEASQLGGAPTTQTDDERSALRLAPRLRDGPSCSALSQSFHSNCGQLFCCSCSCGPRSGSMDLF